MRALLLCLVLCACGGRGAPIIAPIIAPAAAQSSSCGTDWIGQWETEIGGAWCGMPAILAPSADGTEGPGYATHTAPAGVPGPYFAGIATRSFAINDNPNGALAWGAYHECDNMVDGSGPCFGMEIDVAAATQGAGSTTGLWIGCGSGWINPAKYDCTQAIGVTSNVKQFSEGLEFKPGSVSGSPAPVIVLNPGQCIVNAQRKPLLCG